MSSISSELRARTTPNSAITASVTASSPAIEAVCDFAALVPSSLRPTFCMTIGFFAARAAWNAAINPAGLANALGVDCDHVHFGIFRQPADAFAHRHVGFVAGHDAERRADAAVARQRVEMRAVGAGL